MANKRQGQKNATRYEQLPDDLIDLYRSGAGGPLIDGRLRSFTGKRELKASFELALDGFKRNVADFISADILIDGFVLMCNSRRQVNNPRAYEGFRSILSLGVLAYARQLSLNEKPLIYWPVDLASKFAHWIKNEAVTQKGKRLNLNTGRKYYGEFCSLFAELQECSKTSICLPKFEDFPNSPFSGAHGQTEKTKSLGLLNLIAILRAARADFLESVRRFRYAQELYAGQEVLCDFTKKSKLRYRDIDALLWYLYKTYKGNFPVYTNWRQSDLSLFEAINKLHGGWANVGSYFYPFSHSCVAPIILLTIYGHFSVEALRALRLRQVRKISILRSDHIEIRTTIQPGKNRGTAYRRSFPIDQQDYASPNSILEFMLEWTESLRSRAGIYSDYVFIFMTKENVVKGFETSSSGGRSSDSKWMHHLKEFCIRNNLPVFNLRELRQTSLDFGRQISGDDIREIAALKGGSSKSVIDFHYRSDAAEIRAQANIGELQANNERYIRTDGKSNHFGAQHRDISAATPGCYCADPYDSPIPGEVKGSLCAAFGCCPGCPHGSPVLGSEHALARLLQLREALQRSKADLPIERWIQRYAQPLEVLEKKWLPLFDDSVLWERVKRITLEPIGIIE